MTEEERGRAKKLRKQATEAKMLEDVPPMLPFQAQFLLVYNGDVAQIIVAALIIINFVVSAVEAQVAPNSEEQPLTFVIFETVFNVLFAVELFVNMYANFFCSFWKSGWNIFDFIIVFISWAPLLGFPKITILRLFRAFRAFRLFNRVPAIRSILIGVAKSLPGVSNAFVLLVIIMGIWSILGVQWFRHDFPILFGHFGKAMLTVFQVMTFDSWVSEITRPICLYYNDPIAPLYFISYVFVTGIIMMNVVVAILLDQFMKASEEIAASKQAEEREEEEPESIVELVAERVLDEGEREPAEAEDHGASYWGLVTNHFTGRISSIETLCRSSLGERRHSEPGGARLFLEEAEAAPPIKPPTLQERVRQTYESPPSQIFVAGAITVNFILSSIQAEIIPEEGKAKWPDASDKKKFFIICEWTLNATFTVELIINMFANWFKRFWFNSWNLFDFFIVLISDVSMIQDALPGDAVSIPGISVLRLFRAFRVFRLFKRVRSLRQIIAGIMKSLPDVSYAFVILGLVMGIWSIIGVSQFGEDFPELFGDFFKAMLSMFQVMSFDSWSQQIARPVTLCECKLCETCKHGPGIAPVFFITYVFITAIIMSNVVLAILLDKFLSAAKEFDAEEDEADQGGSNGIIPVSDIVNVFDPNMEISLDHLREFDQALATKLTELERLLQGPVKEYLTAHCLNEDGAHRRSWKDRLFGSKTSAPREQGSFAKVTPAS